MFQLEKLTTFKNLIHGFSDITEGNMSFNWGDVENVKANRLAFLKTLGINSDQCVCMSHEHKDKILEATTSFRGKGIMDTETTISTDALVTKQKGVFLFMVTADCLPIILFDPKKEVLALVHAGWRGVDAKITPKAILKMQKEYNCDPKNIIVGIGPAIRKESYKFENPNQSRLSNWENFIKKEDELTSIDIVGYTIAQLTEVGIFKNNIFDSEIDTGIDKNFFSHYRSQRNDEIEGRFASIVGLKTE